MSREECRRLDLSQISDSDELQAFLRDSLEFPGWYGCNWNAFWDAITALVEMPVVLHLEGWSLFEERLPNDADIMRQCLEEMSREHPDIASDVKYA